MNKQSSTPKAVRRPGIRKDPRPWQIVKGEKEGKQVKIGKGPDDRMRSRKIDADELRDFAFRPRLWLGTEHNYDVKDKWFDGIEDSKIRVQISQIFMYDGDDKVPIFCKVIKRRPLVTYQMPILPHELVSKDVEVFKSLSDSKEEIHVFLRPTKNSATGVYQAHVHLNDDNEIGRQKTMEFLLLLAHNPRAFVGWLEKIRKNTGKGVYIQWQGDDEPVLRPAKDIKFNFPGEKLARVLFQVGGNLSSRSKAMIKDEDIPYQGNIPSCLLYTGPYTIEDGQIIVNGETFWASDWP